MQCWAPRARYLIFAIAALLAGLIIGFSDPTLVENDEDEPGVSAVTCGPAFGGSAQNATEEGEANCAQIRSGRFNWGITLLVLSGALTVLAFGYRSVPKPPGSTIPATAAATPVPPATAAAALSPGAAVGAVVRALTYSRRVG